MKMLGVNDEGSKNKIVSACHKGRMWQLYSRSNSIKSPALGVGQCVSAIKAVEAPVFACLSSGCNHLNDVGSPYGLLDLR